jgi:hypothetical protein
MQQTDWGLSQQHSLLGARLLPNDLAVMQKRHGAKLMIIF